MKNIIYIIVLSLAIYSCDTEEDITIATPSDIANLSAEPRTGGALLSWDLPADSSFTYLEVRYFKNEKPVLEKVSKYTDTLLIEGLINAEEFVFEVQSVNEVPSAIAKGNTLTTNAVRPISREPAITYYENELELIPVTEDMLNTFTQEVNEGPKENLVDGDPATFWHSSWSANVAPLPHWIQVNFDEATEMGAISYWHRSGANQQGMPSQFGLEVSSDGEDWERVWESRDNLSTDPSREYELVFDKNYESQYFRIMILKNPGSLTFTYLGEISMYTMGSSIVDKEEEAEEEYYNY